MTGVSCLIEGAGELMRYLTGPDDSASHTKASIIGSSICMSAFVRVTWEKDALLTHLLCIQLYL